MPTCPATSRPTRALARTALLLATGLSFLGLTLYVVRLPALLAPLTESVATSLGQIGLVFAISSLTGALGLTRVIARMPLTHACALLVGATSVALLLLVVLDAHRSVIGLLVFQVPFGMLLGSSASLLPIIVTDMYPSAMRGHATAVLASVGGGAAALGGFGADVFLRQFSGEVVIVMAAACALPLVATLRLARLTPGSGQAPAGFGASIRQTFTARRFRECLAMSALTALLIQPVRALVAPLCHQICATAPTDTGKFVAAIAGGLALTVVATRLSGGRLPHVTIIFGACAVVFLLLAAGDAQTSGPILTVGVLGLLVAVGLILGLVQTIVLEGIQRVGSTAQRVSAVGVNAAGTTVVAAVAASLWGVGFDAIGVTPSLVLAAVALGTVALVLLLRGRHGSDPRSTELTGAGHAIVRPVANRLGAA